MLEKDLRRKMVKRLEEVPGCRVRVVHGGPHQSAGEPDLDAVICGVPLKIEVKLPGNKPTKLQAHVIDEWRAAGAVAGWADSMDTLEALIEEALARSGNNVDKADGGV